MKLHGSGASSSPGLTPVRICRRRLLPTATSTRGTGAASSPATPPRGDAPRPPPLRREVDSGEHHETPLGLLPLGVKTTPAGSEPPSPPSCRSTSPFPTPVGLLLRVVKLPPTGSGLPRPPCSAAKPSLTGSSRRGRGGGGSDWWQRVAVEENHTAARGGRGSCHGGRVVARAGGGEAEGRGGGRGEASGGECWRQRPGEGSPGAAGAPSSASIAGLVHEECITKIRLMSLLVLSSHCSGEIPYSAITDALKINDDEVEFWIVKAISCKILDCKIDQLNQVVIVSRHTERIFGMPQWQSLRAKLGVWRGANPLPDKASQNVDIKPVSSTNIIRSHSATGSLHGPQLNQ